MLTRLHKYIAECGVASRRKAEELIRAGRITVNGEAVTKMGIKVDGAKDKVALDGKMIRPETRTIYIKLNKPRGYVSSCRSERGERTVLDLVKDIKERLYPVGRLDMDSEGLLILTNDGEAANRLMHPRYEHEKEYVVRLRSPVTGRQLEQLAKGIEIDGQRTLPAKIKLLGETEFSIILKEGKKRQIRRMVEVTGNRVIGLKRVRIGKLTLGKLPTGKYAHLTSSEIHSLML